MTTTAPYQVSLLPDWRSSTLPFTRPPKDLSKTQTLPWLCITRRRKLGLFMVLIPADLFRLNASTCSTHTLQIPNFSGAFWRSAPDGHQTTVGNRSPLPPTRPSSLRTRNLLASIARLQNYILLPLQVIFNKNTFSNCQYEIQQVA